MKPTSYELTNFCQYNSAKYTYEPGVSVFWAENGFGKTNLWDVGQFFSWTGTIPGGASKKDVVKWGEKKGGAVFTFEHRGIEYTLSWAVPGSSCSMTWTEEGEVHNLVKAGDIQAKLETDIFNMPLRMLREVCFVPQGSFANTIVDKTARTEYFSRITDTKRFSTIRDRVVKLKALIPVHADVGIEIDNQKESISELEARTKELKTEVSEAEKAYEKVKENGEEARRILRMPVDDDIRKQVEQLESTLKQESENPPEEVAEPEVPEVPEDLVKQALSLQAPAVNIRDVEKQKAELIPPEPPEVTESRVDLELESTLHPIALRSIDKGECLVCGHEITPESKVSAEQDRSTEAKKALNSLDEYARAKAVYDSEFKALDTALRTQTANRDNILESLQSREDVELCEIRDGDLPFVYTSQGIEVQGSEWENLLEGWNTYRTKREKFLESRTAVSEHASRLSDIRTRLADLQKGGTVSSDQQMAARQVLQWVGTKEKECTDLKNELASKEAELNASLKSLKTLEAQQAKRNETERLRKLLEVSADVLKPSRLPMRVMRPFLGPYNRRLSQYMEKSMVEYTCRMTPQFEYEFNNGDGWKPANRMSGGQLGNLAMCAQLAKMDVVAQGCPLLVLDEPTYGLDEQRKRGMVQSLRDLNAKEKGLYIMVVSHDPLLKEAADKLITPENIRST